MNTSRQPFTSSPNQNVTIDTIFFFFRKFFQSVTSQNLLEPQFQSSGKKNFRSGQRRWKHKRAPVLSPFYIPGSLFPAAAAAVCEGWEQGGAGCAGGRGGGRGGWVGEAGIRWLKATLQHLCWKTYELMMAGAADQKLANGGGGGVPWGEPGLLAIAGLPSTNCSWLTPTSPRPALRKL